MDTHILYKRAKRMAEEQTSKLDYTKGNECKENFGIGSANAKEK